MHFYAFKGTFEANRFQQLTTGVINDSEIQFTIKIKMNYIFLIENSRLIKDDISIKRQQ